MGHAAQRVEIYPDVGRQIVVDDVGNFLHEKIGGDFPSKEQHINFGSLEAGAKRVLSLGGIRVE